MHGSFLPDDALRAKPVLKESLMLRRAIIAAVPSFSIIAMLGGTAPADPMLKDFEYPFEVREFAFTSQMLPLTMAYMDVAPQGAAKGETAVLFHGKNFCAATWEKTIRALAAAGYRVIAPDQIGFCKSSKPEHYQYSFQQLAANTHALLADLGVKDPIVIGHSTGGMLAFRYALMYPQETKAIATVNPIGLEDWKAKGVPMATVDELYQGELKTTADSIRDYERKTYYAGEWQPHYEKWVDMLAAMYAGGEGWRFAWSQALTSDMIFCQPVVYEFANIRVPTLLLIGEKDNTAIGKNRASAEVQKRIGNYRELGPETAKAIPGSILVTFPDYGHAPQIQDPDRFNDALLKNLEKLLSREKPK
jgi:pimeloyl-ACP methyl ester carboxylesterase